MANEIVTGDLTTNGGLVAEILAALVHEQIYDPTDLRAVCTRVPWTAGGSTTMAVTSLPAPAAYATAAETVAIANSTFTTSEYTLTAARYGRAYEITDLVSNQLVLVVDLQVLAGNLANGMSITISNLIAALFPSVTAQRRHHTASTFPSMTCIDAQFALSTTTQQPRARTRCCACARSR
jgi:hypothetical protein